MESTRNMRIASRMILFAIVVTLLLILLPVWPYSRTWSYVPSLGLTLAVAILATVFFRVTPRRL